ncbi:MAG: methyltransferase domain-containing protein [Nitrososphaerota archaeon]|nr:class I SAM-dependent methyltransferase [Candidatus Calditenuaceae archaeon]MDW8073816.1 methyltransferase domain-containing protein [Nitrososphaerota archaeon]
MAERSYYELSLNRFPSKYWHRNIIETARRMVEGSGVRGPVLDLGCGDGVRTRMIVGDALEVHGVDIDPEMVIFAKKRLNKVYLASIDGDLSEILDSKYGTVLLFESLEHVRDPERVLQNAAKLLEDRGLLVVIVPLETTLFKIIWWLWTKTLGRRWREAHLYKFKSVKQLLSMLERDFKVLEYRLTNLGCIIVAICQRRERKEGMY